MNRSFGMNGEHRRSGIDECRDESVGVGDHQVDVERQPGHFSDGSDYWRTDGDIGHKVAVHHIDMERVSPGVLDLPNVITKGGKICGQNRGRNPNVH
jgi:hypothetical protein